ncbi:hypothetical protein MXB_2366 [Myxobolus squamalis]|nr:hypothetical protein MXB_2366 [Myxobolus squamalis]
MKIKYDIELQFYLSLFGLFACSIVLFIIYMASILISLYDLYSCIFKRKLKRKIILNTCVCYLIFYSTIISNFLTYRHSNCCVRGAFLQFSVNICVLASTIQTIEIYDSVVNVLVMRCKKIVYILIPSTYIFTGCMPKNWVRIIGMVLIPGIFLIVNILLTVKILKVVAESDIIQYEVSRHNKIHLVESILLQSGFQWVPGISSTFTKNPVILWTFTTLAILNGINTLFFIILARRKQMSNIG